MTQWSVRTEPQSLSWLDPGPNRDALADALHDCVATLSPVGQPPHLSTYWIDHLLNAIEEERQPELAHGNLWVFKLAGDEVHLRMDVDDPSSDPIDSIAVDDLRDGLRQLRAEVERRIRDGHQLDDRWWAQKNPPI